MRFHRLEKEPVVVGTYNDIVLCCASWEYQRDYYICNPCTFQWLPLPPPPEVYRTTPVGFICDLPYYQCKEGDDVMKEGKHIQVNSQYRGRVLRLISHGKSMSKFKVQIFSTETGEWTESIVSSLHYGNDMCSNVSYPYNGLLYWITLKGDLLLGLDPFMITDRNTCTPGDHYQCHLILLDHPRPDENEVNCPYNSLGCLGEYRGCLQISNHNDEEDIITLWKLNEEAISAEARKFCLVHTGVDHEPIWEPFLNGDEVVHIFASDPNDDGTLYLRILQSDENGNEIIYMYKMKTGLCSKIDENKFCRGLKCTYFYQLVLPCFPTPVPRRQAVSIVGSKLSQ